MASVFDRIGGAIGGVSIPKGQELTPEQRAQVTSAYMNAAQALLAASDNPRVSFGGALGQGLGGAAAGVQKTMKAQRDAEIARQQARADQMQMQINQLALDKAKDVSNARQGAPRFSDYKDYTSWAMASADHYFDNDLPDEAGKFISIFKPKTREEQAAFVFDEKNKWDKKTQKLIEAKANYDAVKRLIVAGTGGKAYAAMIKVIKSLDDSVVRDSERRSFNDSFGALEGLSAKLQLAAKGEITDTIGAEILDIAGTTLNVAIKSYGLMAAERRDAYGRYIPMDQALDIVPEFNFQPVPAMRPEDFARMRAKAKKERDYGAN